MRKSFLISYSHKGEIALKRFKRLSEADIERIVDSYSDGIRYLQENVIDKNSFDYTVYSKEDDITLFLFVHHFRSVVEVMDIRKGNKCVD